MWMMLPAAASAVGGIAGQAASANAAGAAAGDARDYIGSVPDLMLPKTDYSYLDYAGDYSPYAIGAPSAAQYQTISEDPQTRAVEMAALQKLAQQGSDAADSGRAADYFQALSQASQLANQREGAIRQSMERKGQGGTGATALMQAQAAQMGANRAQGGMLDATSKAALQKLAAQQGAFQAAGAVRGQDANVAGQNADIINRFNMFNTQARNHINEQNTGNMNAAQLRNLNTRQDIGGRNTGIQNANVDRVSNRAKQMYDARMGKATAMGNAAMGQANVNMQQGQMYNQLGQQGQQLFTNIGSGITAAQNANSQQGSFTPTPSQPADYQSLDGSFKSWWE